MHECVDSKKSPDREVGAGAAVTVEGKPRILIAEDEWAFRILLLLTFEEEGYEVVSVGNGPTLLEVLASSLLPNSGIKSFDLVVSDVRMPGWNGLLALEDLCRSPLMPPVVVITAFGSDELHQRAMQSGAAAVLDKPFDLADLSELGRRLISQHAI
jgi:CheY-like chemotaxis protein